MPDRVAHLSQLGVERCRERPALRPNAKRVCGVGQSGARLPRMTDPLRRVLENFKNQKLVWVTDVEAVLGVAGEQR